MSGLDRFFVPAARALPSNAAYLEHLAVSDSEGIVARLASNENTEPPAPAVFEALARAAAEVNLSPPPVPKLRRLLADAHGLTPGSVLIGAGSTEVIDAVFRTFLRAGDEVVLPSPSWPVFGRRLEALEAAIVAVALTAGERSWAYDVDAMLAAIGTRTKLVVVCTPNNPTGNPLALDDVRRIAARGLPTLIDAAYADFDAEHDATPLVHEFPNVIVTRTFSKAYCLAGVRLGYGLGEPSLMDVVDRFLVPGSSVSRPALTAGVAALADEVFHRAQIARIAVERARLVDGLRGLGYRVWDSSGNFVPVDASEYPGGPQGLTDAILRGGVVVRPLYDLVRISVGRTHENDALLAAAAAAA